MEVSPTAKATPQEETPLLEFKDAVDKRLSFVQPNFYGNAYGYSDSLRDLPLDSRDSAKRSAERALDASIAANVILLGLKLFATVATGSLAILASLVDSLLDLLSQVVLYCTDKLSSLGIDADFPAGRRRLEPVGVIICAAFMGTAALEVLREAVVTILKHAGGPAGQAPLPTESMQADAILGIAIVVKAVLYIWCNSIARTTKSHSVAAVAQDHQNDVLSNFVALAAAVCANLRGGGALWWIDPVGAILISIYIIYSWVETGREQVEMVVGRSADPDFLEQVKNLANHHHASLECDIIRAYHFGPKFLVEVEVVLPEKTALRESHDIGMALQWKIEALEDVERAFVHIDYQTRDYDEHDERSWRGHSEESGEFASVHNGSPPHNDPSPGFRRDALQHV